MAIKKLFNIITSKPLVTLTYAKLYAQALLSDHSLLFHHVVAYESSFSQATSSSCDHFSEFPRRSLTRASTVGVFGVGKSNFHGSRVRLSLVNVAGKSGG